MNDDMNAQDDQALADEWAAALEETGDAGQDDIDALLAADTAGSSSNRSSTRPGSPQSRLPCACARPSSTSGSAR